MADRYTGAFFQLEKSLDNTISMPSTHPALLELTAAMKGQRMSVNDALWLLHLSMDQYRRQKRKDAMRFCALEMQRIYSCSRNRNLWAMYPKIDFETPVSDRVRHVINRQRSLYDPLFYSLFRKWTFGVSIFLAAFLLLSVFILHFPFFASFWILLAGWFYLQWMGRWQEVPAMISRRLKNLREYLDPELQELIKSWNIEIPPAMSLFRNQLKQVFGRFLRGKRKNRK